MSGVKVALLLLPWLFWQNSKISINVSAVLNILLPWPSNLFYFNTLIALFLSYHYAPITHVHTFFFSHLLVNDGLLA